MMLSVTTDIAGKSGFINVPISDVAFIEFDSIISRIYVHTIDEVYYTMGTLKYFIEALAPYDFKQVDRNNVVNMSKIKRLDKHHKTAYFEDEITKKSKRCTISGKNFDDLVRSLIPTSSTSIRLA